MSGVTRDTSGDAAAAFFAGQKAYWAGEALLHGAGLDADYNRGWLAAAAEASRILREKRELIDRAGYVKEALTQAYGALDACAELPRLLPGLKSRINTAAVLCANAAPTLTGDLRRSPSGPGKR